MGRKVFMSFLGTGIYTACNYYEENNSEKKVNNVYFIQEALIKLYCKDFGKGDKIFIFLTHKAKIDNWKNAERGRKGCKGEECGNEYRIGLNETLKKVNLKADIVDIDYDETDIWNMFNKMFDVLNENDEVIFDVTHSFRYIPMLAMVMFNYAKFLKNIKLKAIYYGAFEKRDDNNNAPIIDLTAFDELQQWSVGADNFVNYGNADKIIGLINNEISPIMRKTKGKDENSLKLNGFHKKLEKTLELFSTIRGREIINASSIIELKNYLNEIRKNELEFKALAPILQKIEEVIVPYKENSLNNLIITIEFYIKNKQIQQAITLIQEAIITLILENEKLPYDEVEIREIVSSVIYVRANKIEKGNWSQILKNNIWISKKLYENKLLEILYKDYESLRNYRNSINHGGFISKDYIQSDKFEKQLIKVFKSFKDKVYEI